MATERQRLTDARAVAIQPPVSGRAMIHDAKLPGFALRVTEAGSKSWVVYRRIAGQPRIVTIGTFPAVKEANARKEATKALGKAAEGLNVTDLKREARAKSVTLSALLDKYLEARGDHLRERTAHGYKLAVKAYFGDWLTRGITALGKDEIERRHRKVTLENGPGVADGSFRILRALLNFAADQYVDSQGRSIIPENPVRRLSAVKAWNHLPRKQTIIPDAKFADWWQAVADLPETFPGDGELWRDYFQFLALTGMRKGEAARLLAADVNEQRKSFTLRGGKNGHDLTLPASDAVLEILARRIKAAGEATFVFPANSASGHVEEPKKPYRHVADKCGVSWTPHDLRRGFATMAEKLDLSGYALKALLGHRSGSAHGDVTAGYIVLDLERLRGPMQRITDALLTLAGIKKPDAAQVVALPKRKAKARA